MAKRRRRRNWTDEEKIEICRQTTVPGVSVSRVARRYDVNANQVFNWLKDPRFKPDTAEEDTGAADFSAGRGRSGRGTRACLRS